MRICMLKQEELPKAMQLLWEVFAECTAPLYSPQGVEEFRSFIEIEHISKLYIQKQMFFWGAFENDVLLGVSAVYASGHISFLEVRPAYQNQGIENALFQNMQQFCAQKLGNMRMNVHAAPNAVIKYQSLGFQISANEQQQNGVRYVPMEYIIRAADIKAEIKKSHIGLMGGIILALVIVAIFVVVILSRAAQKGISDYKNRIETEDSRKDNSRTEIEDNRKDNSRTETEDNRKDNSRTKPEDNRKDNSRADSDDDEIDSIPAYLAENLSYSIDEKEYYKVESSDKTNVHMDIQYPQITGLEGDKAEEINKLLEDCAMDIADQLYLNPNEKVKEIIQDLDYPHLESKVRYKITYMSEDIISVVFEDEYFFGSIYAEFCDLRTRTINLKSGTVYEIKDIVNLDDDFMNAWYDSVKAAEPEATVIDLISLEEYKRVFEGEVVESRYTNAFYLKEDGIDIGLTYHYGKDGLIVRGWMEAPFTFDEIADYKSDSDLWRYVE